jgi:hypothetical protein
MKKRKKPRTKDADTVVTKGTLEMRDTDGRRISVPVTTTTRRIKVVAYPVGARKKGGGK